MDTPWENGHKVENYFGFVEARTWAEAVPFDGIGDRVLLAIERAMRSMQETARELGANVIVQPGFEIDLFNATRIEIRAGASAFEVRVPLVGE